MTRRSGRRRKLSLTSPPSAAHAGGDPAGVRETHHGEESRMSIVAIAHHGGRHGPEDFASRLDAESTHVMELYAKEKIGYILRPFR